MKRKRARMVIFAIAAGVLFLAGGGASAAEEDSAGEYRTEENVQYEVDGQDAADEERLNYERFKNLENTSVQMDFLRSEKLQQKTRLLLFVVLAATVFLFVYIKGMIYKREKEKGDGM